MISFLLPWLRAFLLLMLFALAVAFFMDWLERRARRKAVALRHDERYPLLGGIQHALNCQCHWNSGRYHVSAECRVLTRLYLESKRLREERKGAAASTAARN